MLRRSESRDNFDLNSSGGGSRLLRKVSGSVASRVKFNPNVVCDLSKLEMLEGSLEHFVKVDRSKGQMFAVLINRINLLVQTSGVQVLIFGEI